MNDQTALILRITRTLDATRACVLDAWTNTDSGWWGPKDCTLLFHESDLKPGGRWRMGIRREGETHISSGIYREIAPPGRLVMTNSWEDTKGNVSLETLVTLTLTEHGGKTQMIFEQTGFADIATRDSHRDGWTEALDALDAALTISKRVGI